MAVLFISTSWRFLLENSTTSETLMDPFPRPLHDRHAALVHGPKPTVKLDPQCRTRAGVTVDEVPEAQPIQVHEEGLSRS